MSSPMLTVFVVITTFAFCAGVTENQCPSSLFETYDAKCYVFAGADLRWSKAKSLCANYGLAVMSVRDEAALVYFRNKVRPFDGESLWVGATDTLNEGQFIWEDTRQPITVDFEQIFNRSTNTDDKDCLMASNYEDKIIAVGCETSKSTGYCMGELNAEDATTTPRDVATNSTTKKPGHPCKKG